VQTEFVNSFSVTKVILLGNFAASVIYCEICQWFSLANSYK